MLPILLQFLHANYNVLVFDRGNVILVNALSKYFFVIDFDCFRPCFFERADFILVWAASALFFSTLLSPSFFISPSRYPT